MIAVVLARAAESTDEVCSSYPWPCDAVYDSTGNEVGAHIVGWLTDKPLKILIILAVAYVGNRILRHVIARAGTRMASSADKLGEFVPTTLRRSDRYGRGEARAEAMSTVARSVASTIIVIFAVAGVLSVLGVSLAALFASAGVLGVALGFGAQNLVRDVLAGWFILIEDRYGVGDIIDAGPPAAGVVERVTLRSTRLRDVNGTVWHVANGEILRVGNKSQSWSRAVVDVVISPGAKIDRACEVLAEVGRALYEEPLWSDRMTAEPEVLGVHLMDPTGVTLRVISETVPASQFDVEREFRRRILRAFDNEKIPLADAAAALRQGYGAAPGTTQPPAAPPPRS